MILALEEREDLECDIERAAMDASDEKDQEGVESQFSYPLNSVELES